MLPISTKQTVRFTPPEAAAQENPPVYLLAVPAVWARAEFLQRLARAGAVNPSEDELRQALADGVRATYPADEAAALVALVARAAFDRLPGEDAARLAAAEREVRRTHAPYRELLGERTRYLELQPLVACKMLLKGVENVDVTFTTEHGEVSDETMAALEAPHLVQAGMRAFDLLFLPRGPEKNSESPSPSPSPPATSAAAASPPTPPSSGGSSGRSTKKTRASS